MVEEEQGGRWLRHSGGQLPQHVSHNIYVRDISAGHSGQVSALAKERMVLVGEVRDRKCQVLWVELHPCKNTF